VRVDLLLRQDQLDFCLERFQAMAPVQQWLVKVLQDQATTVGSRHSHR